MYVIHGPKEYDAMHDEHLFWNNEIGWVPLDEADVVTDEERANNPSLPVGGVWMASEVARALVDGVTDDDPLRRAAYSNRVWAALPSSIESYGDLIQSLIAVVPLKELKRIVEGLEG